MAETGAAAGRGKSSSRTIGGILLAVCAGLAAALAPVAIWGNALLSDTDTFDAAYGPVVRSSELQQVVSTRLTEAVVVQLGIGDNALVRGLVTQVVGQVVASDAFADATVKSLQLAREQLLAQLTGDYASMGLGEGVVLLPYAPYVEAIQQQLIAAGVPVIAQVPQVSGGITLLTIDPQVLPRLQAGYRVLGASATWLPWLAIGLAIAAVLVWPGVRGPLIGLGLSLLGSVLVVGLAWNAAVQGLWNWLGEDLRQVAGMIADVTGSPVATPLIALGVFGAALAGLSALSALIVPSRGGSPADRTD